MEPKSKTLPTLNVRSLLSNKPDYEHTEERRERRATLGLRESTEAAFRRSEHTKMLDLSSLLKTGQAVVTDRLCYKMASDSAKGRGLFSIYPLRKWTFLGTYPGELVPESVARERDYLYGQMSAKAEDVCYTLYFSMEPNASIRSYLFDNFDQTTTPYRKLWLAFDADDCIVDYSDPNNAMGIMNHSSKKRNVIGSRYECLSNQMPFVAFFTACDVPNNTELLWDYNDKENENSMPWLKQ